jgi:transposase
MSTLQRWLSQQERTGSLASKPMGSRPWKLDHDAVVAYVKQNNDKTLQEIAGRFGTVPSVIDYILRKHKVTRKKNHALRRAGRREKTHIPCGDTGS